MNAGKRTVLRNVTLHIQPKLLVRPPQAQVSGGETKLACRATVGGCASDVAVAPASAAPAEPAINDAYNIAFAQGLQAGREQGLEQGLAHARARIDDAVQAVERTAEIRAQAQLQEQIAAQTDRIDRLDSLLTGFEMAIQTRVTALQQDAVALAHGALCKIVGDAVLDPEMVAAVVAQATHQLRGAIPLRVRMSELDLQLLHNSEQGRALMSVRRGVEWLADPALQVGGCMLDTEQGTLDARLQTQFVRLQNAWISAAAQWQAHAEGCPP